MSYTIESLTKLIKTNDIAVNRACVVLANKFVWAEKSGHTLSVKEREIIAQAELIRTRNGLPPEVLDYARELILEYYLFTLLYLAQGIEKKKEHPAESPAAPILSVAAVAPPEPGDPASRCYVRVAPLPKAMR